MSVINLVIVPENESNRNPMIHHSLSSSIQIQTEGIESSPQHPPIISSINDNSDAIPIAISYNRRMNSPLSPRNIFQIREYKCLSLITTMFCCFFIGLCAIKMSWSTRKNKRLGNIIKAKDFSKLTFLFNIIAVTSGLMMVIVTLLRYTGNLLP